MLSIIHFLLKFRGRGSGSFYLTSDAAQPGKHFSGDFWHFPNRFGPACSLFDTHHRIQKQIDPQLFRKRKIQRV